jgi:hypothetical protein
MFAANYITVLTGKLNQDPIEVLLGTFEIYTVHKLIIIFYLIAFLRHRQRH